MDQIAALIGEIELYGLGRDEVDGYFARIDKYNWTKPTRLSRNTTKRTI